MRRPLPPAPRPRIAIQELARPGVRSIMDQFAKPGILPPDSKRLHASKRSRQSRATFVATSTCVLVAATHPCAGAVLQTAYIDVVAYAMPRQVRSTAQMNTYAKCAARRDARLACGRCRCAQRARRHRAGDVDLDDSRSPMLSEAAAVRVMQCIVNRGGRLMLQSSQNTRAYPPSCPEVRCSAHGRRSSRPCFWPIRRPASDRGHPQRFERGADRNRARLAAEHPGWDARDGLAHRLRA